jgi:hypothetical protein
MGNSIVDSWKRFKSGVDTINREGYEWFMHFLFHPLATRDEYVARYQGKNPRLRLAWSVLWRLPLMIFPVLPALYVVNRTVGVLLNPVAWYKNFNKSSSMALFVLVAVCGFGGAYSDYIARPTFAASAGVITQGLHLGVGAALQVPVALGILVAGACMLGALLMYMGKHFARNINVRISDTSTTKHFFNNTGPIGPFVPLTLASIHKNVRSAHFELKRTLNEDPASIAFNNPDPDAKLWGNEHLIQNPIDAAEDAIKQGKVLLNELEDMMNAQKDNEPVSQRQAEEVILETGKPTLLRQWEASMNLVRPRAEPVILPPVKLDYDKTHSKIIERTRATA